MVDVARMIYRDHTPFPATVDDQRVSPEVHSARLLRQLLHVNEVTVVIRPAGQIRQAMQFRRNEAAFLEELAAETTEPTFLHLLRDCVRGNVESPGLDQDQLTHVSRCVRKLGFGSKLHPRLEGVYGYAAPRIQDVVRGLVLMHLCTVILARPTTQERLLTGIRLCCEYQHFPLGELKTHPGTFLVIAP